MSRQRGSVEILIVAAIVVVLVLAFIGISSEAKEWEAFRAAHKCKVVGHIRGEAFNTINSSGSVGIGITSDKTGWLCDDGVTYYR
jgi:hypothetical protein